MFERYSGPSKAVLAEAQELAVELGSGYISVGHLFYGCAEVRDETAGRPLLDYGITSASVRRLLPHTPEEAAGPVDPEALRAIGVDSKASGPPSRKDSDPEHWITPETGNTLPWFVLLGNVLEISAAPLSPGPSS